MQKTKNKWKKSQQKWNGCMMTTMFSDSYGRNSFCEFVFHEYSVLTCSSLHKQDSTPIPTPPLILVVHTVSTCPHAVCLVTCTHTHSVDCKRFWSSRDARPPNIMQHFTLFLWLLPWNIWKWYKQKANSSYNPPGNAYQHFRLGGAQGVVDMRIPEAQTLFQSSEPMSWRLSNNNPNAYSKRTPWTSMLSLTAKSLAAQDKHFSSGQFFQFKTINYWSCKPHSILDLEDSHPNFANHTPTAPIRL